MSLAVRAGDGEEGNWHWWISEETSHERKPRNRDNELTISLYYFFGYTTLFF